MKVTRHDPTKSYRTPGIIRTCRQLQKIVENAFTGSWLDQNLLALKFTLCVCSWEDILIMHTHFLPSSYLPGFLNESA